MPLGTDTFVQNFVRANARIFLRMLTLRWMRSRCIDSLHYQLLHFCQTTCLQYVNSHFYFLGNQNVLQQHVDPEISMTDALTSMDSLPMLSPALLPFQVTPPQLAFVVDGRFSAHI